MPSEAVRIPEAAVERYILRAIGSAHDVLALKNEVGQFYKPTILPALRAALAPWGREALAAALDAIARHRIVCGLGVGSPDVVGAVAGRAFGIECKAADGALSPEQARWLLAASRRGLTVGTARDEGQGLEVVALARRGLVCERSIDEARGVVAAGGGG